MKTSKKILALAFSFMLCMFLAGALMTIYQPELTNIQTVLVVAGVIMIASILVEATTPAKSFFTACSSASAAILFNCETPLVGGTVTTMYVGNLSDVVEFELDPDNNLVVVSITLDVYGKIYKLEGASGTNGSSVAAKAKMVKLAYGRAWDHEVGGLAFAYDPDTKLEIQKRVGADMFAIVENKHRGTNGNCAFEIYGLNGGLQMEELERDPNDKDTLGAFKFIMKTQESSRESQMPYTLWDTDYATTLALITALL